MIKLKVLKLNNCLPFGKGIEIDLAKDITTQLVGKNGSGKSSIPILLEELLYNTNSKGLRKSDILNRYSGSTEYSMSLTFEVDGKDYFIEKVVKSTAKVTLYEGAKNISGHTATQTYKVLADILGMDSSTFSKLVYQSLVSSLDFLTATDGNRKKFLVKLLGLEQYSSIEEELKNARKAKASELSELEKSLASIRRTITTFSVPELMQEVEVPESLEVQAEQIITNAEKDKADTLHLISEYRNKIDQYSLAHRTYLAELQNYTSKVETLNSIRMNIESARARWREIEATNPHNDVEIAEYSVNIDKQREIVSNLKKEESILQWEQKQVKEKHNILRQDASVTKCPECGSELNKEHQLEELNRLKSKYEALKAQVVNLQTTLEAETLCLNKLVEGYNKAIELKRKYQLDIAANGIEKIEDELGRFCALNNITLNDAISTKPIQEILSTKPIFNLENPKELELKIQELQVSVQELNSIILSTRTEALRVEKIRNEALVHNAKVESHNLMCSRLLETQRDNINREAELELEIAELTNSITNLEVLVKIFGAKGLVAYKLESSVKVFEQKVNEYLSELSSGDFALGFELDEANLKVVIYSAGKQVSINTLSSGELSKVNISTLLAIRSMMSLVAKNSLNVLFLDEVVSVLDVEGMGDLIDTLVKEPDLNTFVVSHNYQHPLVAVIKIIKEDNISRLEYDGF